LLAGSVGHSVFLDGTCRVDVTSLRPDHLDGPTGESVWGEKEGPWKIPKATAKSRPFAGILPGQWHSVASYTTDKQPEEDHFEAAHLAGSNISLVLFTQAVSHVVPHSFLDFSL
jgi:hypothetical protein